MRRWILENNWIAEVIDIPANSFTDTTLPTLCLVLQKNRDVDTIKFVAEDGATANVNRAEVLATDGATWNTRDWISDKTPKTLIDIDAVNQELLEITARRIDADFHKADTLATVFDELEFRHRLRAIYRDAMIKHGIL